MGVRSSWESVARNSSLIRLCCSASSPRLAFAFEQPLALHLGLAFATHVAADPDHLDVDAFVVLDDAAALGDPDDRAIRPKGPVLAFVDVTGRSHGRWHRALPADRRDAARRSQPLARVESPRREAEERLGIGGPCHLARRQVPLPGGICARSPSPCEAAPRSRAQGRGRAVSAAVRSRTRHSRSRLACSSASCAWRRSATSSLSASFRLASSRVFRIEVDEHRDLRSQDVRVDRFAQVVDRSGAVATAGRRHRRSCGRSGRESARRGSACAA